MSACTLCLLLLIAVLVQEGGGVISGPRSRRDLGQQELRTVELAGDGTGGAPSEPLSHSRSAEERAERRLHKRQTSSDGIGYTAALNGDNHNQAVVHWTGYPSEHLFIVTRDRETNDPYSHSRQSWLWRSIDYGHHFHNETGKLRDNDVVIEWYYISPRQSNLIFADRINQRLYVTTDEGDTYTRHDIPFTPDRLRFQSIYSPHSNDSNLFQYVLGYDATNRTLWVSSNISFNWTLLGENVTPGRYYWRVMNTTVERDLTTVYFETAINSTHAQLHYSVYPYSTHDVFDPSLGPFLVNSFVLTHEYMFVQKSASVGGNYMYQSPLWVSHYRKPFRQARFPLQTPERHYSVVDASEGQVFIAVYHSFNNTNLYLSEEQGLNYSLSLEYIISPPESDWINGYPSFDVHVVEGVVGTYIANRKTPGSQYGATVISFDKGGEWNFLTPPAVTMGGSPIICSPPQCSLHLHMNSDRLYGYQSILSQDSAIGLIMALGNLGSAVQRYNYSAQRLYFSHDGGFTWQEVQQNFWEFQFAALGSIVVTVPKWRTTDYVRWSCDEGGHWNTTTFLNSSQSYIRVIGMLTEFGERAQHVTVFGYTGGSFREWLVIDLNFSVVVPTLCTTDDFFNWIPTDERPGSRCLLGEVIAYERRVSEVCCLVDPEYDKPTIRTYCECAIEDFECDFGFERVNLNSPCTPLPYLSWPPSPPTDCQEGSNYTYTSGYRRVAGDRCVPGNETYFLPVTRECPVVAPQGLFISYQPLIITPGINVTFDLTQLLGGRLTTHYTWRFGDGSPVVDIVGYASSHSQVHVFQNPGTYNVNVTVRNNGGTSQTVTVISVLDPITKVAIVLPGQYLNGSVPLGIVLLYSSQVTTRYGTNNTGRIHYSWDFDDGFTSDMATVEHTYSQAGTYQLILEVFNVLSTSNSTTLHVYQVALEVSILSSDVMGARFVFVGRRATFTATPSSTLASIPSDTVFTWHVAGPGGVSSYTTRTNTLTYSFPQQGSYDISVVGNHSAGAFAAQRHLTAEVNISDVNVLTPAMNSTVGVQELTQATLRVLPSQGQSIYTGPLNITVLDQHGVPLASHYYRNSSGGTQSVELSLGRPGHITITFQAANDVSSVTKDVNLLVVDMLTGVSLNFPMQYYSIGAIPTGVSLLFSSDLSTGFNTHIYGDVHYDWNFGDGHILYGTSNSNVSHMYTHPGSLQLTLTAHGLSTTARNITTLRLYQSVQSSSASIMGSDGVEGGRFVHVGRSISLMVQPIYLSQEIPLDTNFTWKVMSAVINTYVVHTETLSYSFPQPGSYIITVTGDHSVGSFTNETHLTAQIDIVSLQVCTVPTVRAFVTTTANFTVLENQGTGYRGLVNISASDKNGTRLAGQRYSSIPGKEGHLDLTLTQPGDISVTLTAANDVSMATTKAHMVVVGEGQYGGLVLLLNATRLLAHHSTSDWHTDLKNSIISHINQTYGVSTLLIEVAFDNSYATAESHTVSIQSKRQSSEDFSLSVEVYILPATYTEDDFNSTMQIAAAVVAEAGAGRLHFMVDGERVVVQNAFLLPLNHLFVLPAATPPSKLYLGLGLGLGLGLIALVSFSTVMVIVTYYYRRKYSRLHVRYSRLQQGPVRFTFTEHGETIQEEDFSDNLSDDEPTFVDDQKLETLRFSQLQEKTDS